MGTAGPADMVTVPLDLSLPPMLSMDKTSQMFGDITINNPSSQTTFVVTNTGTVPTMTPTMMTSGATTDFNITTDCNAPIAALDKCHVMVTFTPKSAGSKQAMFTISAGSWRLDERDGHRQRAHAGAAVDDAGDRRLRERARGATSTKTASFTVKNTGQTTTGTVSVSSNDVQFTAAGCAQTLAPNATCTLTVTFKASTRGTQNASIKAGDGPSDPSPAIASVSGVGLAPATLSISPSPYMFPAGPRQSVAGMQTFTVTNTGDVATNALIALTVTGTNASAFAIASDGCGGNPLMPTPAVCSVTVKFTPSFTGAHSGSLAIRDASSTLKTDALSGSGTPIWVRELSSSAISGSLQSVWASDSTHVWAVGDNQAIYVRTSAGTWTFQPTTSARPPNYMLITGTGATDLWAMDPVATTVRRAMAAWKASSAPAAMSPIRRHFRVHANDVWVMTTITSGNRLQLHADVHRVALLADSRTSERRASRVVSAMWGVSESDLFCAYSSSNCPRRACCTWGIAHRDATGTWTVSDAMGGSTTPRGPHGDHLGTSGSDHSTSAGRSTAAALQRLRVVDGGSVGAVGRSTAWEQRAPRTSTSSAPFGIAQGDG